MKKAHGYSGIFIDETGYEIISGDNIIVSVLYDSYYKLSEVDYGYMSGSWICDKIVDRDCVGIYEIEEQWNKDVDNKTIMEWILKTFPYATQVMIRDNFVEKPIDKVK